MTTISELRAIYPGLTEQRTGGGSSALVHPCDDGGQLLLTVGDGEVPGDGDTAIDCGIYDADGHLMGDEVESIHIDSLQAWMDAALAARSVPDRA